MDLVLLVDFFPETLGNGMTLRLLSAGETSAHANAVVRTESVSTVSCSGLWVCAHLSMDFAFSNLDFLLQ